MSFSVSEAQALNFSSDQESKITFSQWLGRKIVYFANVFLYGVTELWKYIKTIITIAFFETGMTSELIIHATIEHKNEPKREEVKEKSETLTDETIDNDSYYEGE